jgi:hypothetical protein
MLTSAPGKSVREGTVRKYANRPGASHLTISDDRVGTYGDDDVASAVLNMTKVPT